MSRFQLLALLFGCLLVSAPFVRADDGEYEEPEGEEDEEAEAGDASEKDVLVLTTKNFDETIKKHKFVLAEFYAPWCGHCKKLTPEYAKAATTLKSHDADVVLAKIDATVESELAGKFGVSGYPTLKWFIDGEANDYNGPRDADGIVSWIKKKTGPPAITVDSADKLKELEKENQAVVVAYFEKLEGADYEVFKGVAQKIEDVTFVETSSKDVAAVAGLTKAGVAIIKNFAGEERATLGYDATLSADDLSTWVKAEKNPLTLEFNESNSDAIFNSGIKKQLILWGKTKEVNAGGEVFDAYKKVASQFKGKLIFVTVDNEGKSHEPVTNFFGLKDAESPQLVGFFMDGNKKYKMKEEMNEKSLAEFAQAVLDGTAYVEYKSAPIPEKPTDGEVVIVVGKTVDSIVFDDSKDVLLEVYAPWCGHCKQLEPTYKKLAKRFKKVESVVIAKMDGTENEHAKIDVKGFPTILFKAAGETEFKTYDEGDRSLKALTKFIKANAKVAFELPKKEAKESKDEEAKDAKDEL